MSFTINFILFECLAYHDFRRNFVPRKLIQTLSSLFVVVLADVVVRLLFLRRIHISMDTGTNVYMAGC